MDNLNFTYQELLAEIGAKALVIQRQSIYIGQLEAALAGQTEPQLPGLVESEPRALAIAGNGAKGNKG